MYYKLLLRKLKKKKEKSLKLKYLHDEKNLLDMKSRKYKIEKKINFISKADFFISTCYLETNFFKKNTNKKQNKKDKKKKKASSIRRCGVFTRFSNHLGNNNYNYKKKINKTSCFFSPSFCCCCFVSLKPAKRNQSNIDLIFFFKPYNFKNS